MMDGLEDWGGCDEVMRVETWSIVSSVDRAMVSWLDRRVMTTQPPEAWSILIFLTNQPQLTHTHLP